MLRRYCNRCFWYAVYFTAICVGSASSASAQSESASPLSGSPLSSVGAPPDSSQSADDVRTHSADHVRKPTDPPKFDANSQAAASARMDTQREEARPKPKPVRDDADAVMVPQVAEPPTQRQPQTQIGVEPRAETTDQPAIAPQPPADPAEAGDRPASTSLSWPSGEGTDPRAAAPDAPGAAPDAPGVAPAERWNDPWGEQPAATQPRPTTRQVDPWADPPVAAPRPKQAPPSGDEPMPPQLESPPQADPPGPSF